MTVYVTQRPRPNSKGWQPDLSSANRYGELQFIFESDERIYALPGPSLFKARKTLVTFDHEKDFILHPHMTDQIAGWVAVAALLSRNEVDVPPFVNFLYFDRVRKEDGTRTGQDGHYYPIKLEFRK